MYRANMCYKDAMTPAEIKCMGSSCPLHKHTDVILLI